MAVSLLAAALSRWTVKIAFNKPIAGLKKYSDSVVGSIAKLVDTSHQASTASVQQSAAIQETVATVTELNSTIVKSVENAQRSSEVAESSQRVATEGFNAVTEMIKAIDEINLSNNTIMKEIDQSNARITDIVKVITEISQKTKVINDIVFQTKLLSFNASVEAARAGEHGKGFAVVAEEIGNLAQMSGNASREISEMLNASIKKVTGIVGDSSSKIQGMMEIGKTKVNTGIIVARRCGEILQQVVGNVSQVGKMISEISLASKEQALGMNEITNAMNQLDAVTHQNANTAQNAMEYLAAISSQTEELRQALIQLEGGRREKPSGAVRPEKKGEVAPVLKFKSPPTERKRSGTQKHQTLKEAAGSNIPLQENPDFDDV